VQFQEMELHLHLTALWKCMKTTRHESSALIPAEAVGFSMPQHPDWLRDTPASYSNSLHGLFPQNKPLSTLTHSYRWGQQCAELHTSPSCLTGTRLIMQMCNFNFHLQNQDSYYGPLC
jgi:hypothetical protein